jgi:CBS-domain-containing membrane protein
MMMIRDLMTVPAVTVTAETPIGTALRLLDDRKITAMPVVDESGVLVGIVSEADLVQDTALLEDRVPVAAVRTTVRTPPRRVADAMSHLASPCSSYSAAMARTGRSRSTTASSP